jgi:peroxiredoxin
MPAMFPIRRAALALTLAFGTATLGVAAPPAAPVANVAAIGPAIGSRVAMNLALTDSQGKPTTLARISGGKPVMIVLFRSAAWCPYCQAQLKGLGPVAAAAQARGVRFIAVSYDKPETLAAFATKQGLTYPLYSDAGSRMIDALKLRDPQYKVESIAFGVPYPTTLMLDSRGIVKAKSVETDYRIRPTQADQIAMMAAL